MKIPVYTPLLEGNEKTYLNECIDTGWISSDGPFVKKFEEEFAKFAGTKHAISVSSGTAALDSAVWAVIQKYPAYKNIAIPDMTIISCYLAAKRNGLRVELVDIENSLNMNMDQANSRLVMPVHLFGHFCYTSSEDTRLRIDDLSQYWKPQPAIQLIGCYSLYANKMVTTGEGGMVVTSDDELATLIRNYRNLCHSTTRFFHAYEGQNYRMSNIQAAVGLAQLEEINRFILIKQANQQRYEQFLPKGIKLHSAEVPWMHLVELRGNINLSRLLPNLKANGIDTRRLYYPLHRQPFIHKMAEQFPVTDDKYKRCFYLPSGLTLKEEEIRYICNVLRSMLSSTI